MAVHADASGWVWLLRTLVLFQALLGGVMLAAPLAPEIANSLYGMVYPTDPYAAQAVYRWYLTWSGLLGFLTSCIGSVVLLLVAAFPRNPVAIALGVIYILPVVALVVGSVLVAALMVATFLIGVILSIAAIALGFWLLGEFLK